MTKINGQGQGQILRLKGTNQKLDLNKLVGSKIDSKNQSIFSKYDTNGDFVLDQKEAEMLKQDLMNYAGNNILSARELKRSGSGLTLEALSQIAEQQKKIL